MAQDTGSKDIANATRNLISSVEKLYSQSKRVETSISKLNGNIGKITKNGSGESTSVVVLNKMLRELFSISVKMTALQTAIKSQQKNTSLLQNISQTNSAQVSAIQQNNKKDNVSSLNKIANKLDNIQKNTSSGKGDPRTTTLLSQILNTLRRQKPTVERQVVQPRKEVEKPKPLLGQQYKEDEKERQQGIKTGDVGLGPLLGLLGGIAGPYVKTWVEELLDAIGNIFNMEIVQGLKNLMGTLKELIKKWTKPLLDFGEKLLDETIKKTKDLTKYLSEKLSSWGKSISEFSDNAATKLSEIGKNISDKFDELGKGVKETVGKYIDDALAKAIDLGKVASDKVSSWGKAISDFATKISDDTLTTLKNTKEFWGKEFSSAAKNIGEMATSLSESITAVFKNASDAFTSKMSGVGKILGDIGSSISDSVSNLSSKISSGFSTATKSITASIGALYDKLKPAGAPEPNTPAGKQVAALLQPKPEPTVVETPVKPTFLEKVSSTLSSAGSKVAEVGKSVSNKGTEYLTKAEKFIEGSADDLGKVGSKVSNVVGKGVKALPLVGAGVAAYDYGSRRSEISEDTDKKMKVLEEQLASKQISEKEYQEKMAKARERDDIKKGLLNTEVGGGIAAAAAGTALIIGSGGTGAAVITGAAAAATDYFARKGLKIEEVPPVSLDEMADVYEKLTPMEGAQFKVELASASGVEYMGASNTSNAIKRMIVEQFKDKIGERERKEREKEKVSFAEAPTAPGAKVPGMAGNPAVSSAQSVQQDKKAQDKKPGRAGTEKKKVTGKNVETSTGKPDHRAEREKKLDAQLEGSTGVSNVIRVAGEDFIPGKPLSAKQMAAVKLGGAKGFSPEVLTQYEKQLKQVESKPVEGKVSGATVTKSQVGEESAPIKRNQKTGWSTEGMTHISNASVDELLDTPSGIRVGGQLFKPGQELSKVQMAAVKTNLSMGGESNVAPEVLAQYKKQSALVESRSAPVLPARSESAADMLKTSSTDLERTKETTQSKQAQNVVINAPQNTSVTNMGGGQNVGSTSPRIPVATVDMHTTYSSASSFYR